MDAAKPGHTVEFQGLQGAAHLNGTRATLVKFIKTEQRWCVRCDIDNNKVKVKPENLVLHRPMKHPIIGGDFTPEHAARTFGHGAPTEPSPSFAHLDPSTAMGMGGPTNPNAWANGLAKRDHYEWFSNCYQMRCDDDYQWGGCNLHGPYNPDATPEEIADDFLVFCILAHRCQAVPLGWDWPAFLKAAAKFVPFAFEKSDAKERWGSEHYFSGEMGGRSLRYTGTKIYGSPVDQPITSREHDAAEDEVESNKVALQNQVGGEAAWTTLVNDLGQCSRFAFR